MHEEFFISRDETRKCREGLGIFVIQLHEPHFLIFKPLWTSKWWVVGIQSSGWRNGCLWLIYVVQAPQVSAVFTHQYTVSIDYILYQDYDCVQFEPMSVDQLSMSNFIFNLKEGILCTFPGPYLYSGPQLEYLLFHGYV